MFPRQDRDTGRLFPIRHLGNRKHRQGDEDAGGGVRAGRMCEGSRVVLPPKRQATGRPVHSFYSPMRLRQEPIAKNCPATPPGGRAGSPAPLRRSRRSTGPTEGEHQPAPRLQRQDDPLDRATTGNGSGLVVGRDVSCAGGLPRGLLPGSSTACGRQRDGVAGRDPAHRWVSPPQAGKCS